jgi:hypothetical protein
LRQLKKLGAPVSRRRSQRINLFENSANKTGGAVSIGS